METKYDYGLHQNTLNLTERECYLIYRSIKNAYKQCLKRKEYYQDQLESGEMSNAIGNHLATNEERLEILSCLESEVRYMAESYKEKIQAERHTEKEKQKRGRRKRDYEDEAYLLAEMEL